MTPLTVITLVVLVAVLWAAWETHSKKNKIYCIYEGADKTIKEGFVKLREGSDIEFAGKKFKLLPQCVQSAWLTKGIHALFPTRVQAVHLVWNSKLPVDPNERDFSWLTPELNKLINLDNQLKSFFRNFTPPKTTKGNMLLQYMPFIAIILVVLIGFYLFNQFEGMKQVINMMQNQINTIVP